jgi:hypothetical protein
MNDINQKIPFAQSINNFAERKIASEIQLLGKALPCSVVAVSGSIVTVSFDVNTGGATLPTVTIPIFGGEYIRYPTQVGDKGFTIPADVSLRGVSGLGTGIPDLSDPGNLTALVFMPVGNKSWFSVNPNYLVMYGQEGVEITTKNLDCKLTLTSSGITIDLNGGNLNINNGNVIIAGNLTVEGSITGMAGGSITGSMVNNGKDIGSTHVHSGVDSGPDNSGPPV